MLFGAICPKQDYTLLSISKRALWYSRPCGNLCFLE